jgi:hypothetical protein
VLLDQLAEYWRQSCDPALPRLLPYLQQLRQALAAEAAAAPAGDKAAELPDAVYPLF